jgi:hypothetical protein
VRVEAAGLDAPGDELHVVEVIGHEKSERLPVWIRIAGRRLGGNRLAARKQHGAASA